MSASETAFFAAPQPAPDRTLRYGADPAHVIDVFAPAHPRSGLLVLIHGGFWRPAYDRTHARRSARGLADAGWTVASVDYRRVPGDPDASVGDVIDASLAARREFPAGRLVIAGHSAGGHLALIAAVALGEEVSTVVPIGGVTDLGAAEHLDLGDGAVHAFLGCAASARPDLDPMRLPLPAAAVGIVHGADDGIVPASQALSYARRSDRITADVLADVDHFGPMDPDSAAWSVTLAAISRT